MPHPKAVLNKNVRYLEIAAIYLHHILIMYQEKKSQRENVQTLLVPRKTYTCKMTVGLLQS